MKRESALIVASTAAGMRWMEILGDLGDEKATFLVRRPGDSVRRLLRRALLDLRLRDRL